MANVVYVQITSWYPISVGAEHYYGKLVYKGKDRQSMELLRTLSQKEATYLNKKDGCHLWSKGEETKRWDTRQQVVEEAEKVWKKHFPDADLLVLGGSANSLEPQHILIGPDWLKEIVNPLAVELQALDWDIKGDRERITEIEETYEEAMKKFDKLGEVI